MGLFPTNAVDGQQVTNDKGTTFEYDDVDDKWFIVNTITVSNIAYNAGTWDTNPDVATKNVIRDKIVLMDAEIANNDSKEEGHAYVEATALTLENDLNMGTHKITGVVDPVADQDAATKKYVDDNAGGVSTATFEANQAIGIANKRWRACPIEMVKNGDASYFYAHNSGADDMRIGCLIDLDVIKNGKNLVITDTRLSVRDADSNDYVTTMRLFGVTGITGGTVLVTDATDLNTPQIKTYGHANQTIGGVYKKVTMVIDCVNTTAAELDIDLIEVEYYYA